MRDGIPKWMLRHSYKSVSRGTHQELATLHFHPAELMMKKLFSEGSETTCENRVNPRFPSLVRSQELDRCHSGAGLVVGEGLVAARLP